MNWRLSARITCPDIGTKVLVRSLGGLEDGGGLLCRGSFTHSAKLLWDEVYLDEPAFMAHASSREYLDGYGKNTSLFSYYVFSED